MEFLSHIDVRQSSLGRVRGEGSTRRGCTHWWMQRVTAVALLPLTIWFVCSVVRLSTASYVEVSAWLSSPVVLALTLALIITTFHHLQLGLQVVIEDYVHKHPAKFMSLLIMKAACNLVGLLCVVSALKVGL